MSHIHSKRSVCLGFIQYGHLNQNNSRSEWKTQRQQHAIAMFVCKENFEPIHNNTEKQREI